MTTRPVAQPAAPPPAEPAAEPASAAAAGDWRRLSARVVVLDLIRLAVSAVPGYLGVVVLNDDGPVWPLVIGSAIGVLGALFDFQRWATTRYRVTADRVETRSGLVVRRRRSIPRDRVRSVDSTAKFLQRLAAVRVVHIGSGESGSPVELDALSHAAADRLHEELLGGEPAALPAEPAGAPPAGHPAQPSAGAAGPSGRAARPEVVIARFRRRWILYNTVTVWAPLTGAGPVFGAYWFLRQFGVDLLDVAGGLIDFEALGPVRTALLAAVVAVPLGLAATAAGFALEYWRFELVRSGTPPETALVTRRGLLTTRTQQRDDRKLRGLACTEPLAVRWWRLADTKVLATGLGPLGADAPAAGVLPRLPLAEVRALAPRILPDGGRPMEAPLHRHPRGALTRRLSWSVLGPLLAAAAIAVFTRTGALPAGWWWLPLTLVPVTAAIAVAAYRALGHTVTGPYLVVRHGGLNRRTVALQRRAVIGWTVEQSLFQRLGGRVTVGVATAAGDRYYRALDVGVGQGIAFIRAAGPELAAQFLEPRDAPATPQDARP